MLHKVYWYLRICQNFRKVTSDVTFFVTLQPFKQIQESEALGLDSFKQKVMRLQVMSRVVVMVMVRVVCERVISVLLIGWGVFSVNDI